MDKQISQRWARLILGVITLLFAGIIYAWSILKAPLAADFGWNAADLAFNFTLTMCFFCLGGLVSGLLAKKTSLRLRMIISAVLVSAGFIIVSQLQGESIVPLYLAYGVMAGTGIGIVYNVIISSTNAWFPDKKGFCSGALMMGFGFSTLVLGYIAGKMIASEDIGWRNTYLVFGIVIGFVLLIAGLLVKLPPAGTEFPKAKTAVKTTAAVQATEKHDYSAVEMIKRFSFWKLFVFFILFAAVGSTAISFAKDYSLSLGASEAFSLSFVGIISVCNGFGRLASGSVFDALGLRRTQLVTSAVVIIATLTALFGVITGSLVIGAVGLCLCGFSYGFSPTVSAAFTGAFYGTKNFALNFSIINLILIPASFTATLAGSLYTATDSYVPIFIILAAFSAVGMLINFSIRKA